MSLENKMHYQFEVNNFNQIGNWTFGINIPFATIFTSNKKINEKIEVDAPCNTMGFNDCMNCTIIGICGSSWMCIIACGLAPLPCVAGAGLSCVVS